MNRVVDCFSLEDDKWTDIDVSTEFDVYPCCAYHGAVYDRKDFEDSRLNNFPRGWNNLKNNSLETILEKYSEVINEENWSSEETCPGICLRFCGKKQHGQRQTYYEQFDHKAMIDKMNTRTLQILSSKVLSEQKATSSFIKQFNADHDSVQFYKNVLYWYVDKYKKLPDEITK
tara:strand:+ start:1096 stop:1614 length:519 start_codon:yes stop_codon:yes gene_type:complete